MSLIKTPQEIAILRKAGKYLGSTLAMAASIVKPGLNLLDLEKAIAKQIESFNCTPSFLGYEDYPNVSCLSVNDVLVHSIPKDYQLKSGDILGIDVGLWYENLCVDSAITIPVGKISDEAERLLQLTDKALEIGIKAAKPGNRIGAISAAVQTVADQAGFGIVRTLTGHGVGHAVHEEPAIPNYGSSADGILIRPGMVLAIEPMFTLGSGSVVTDVDGWTIRTQDGSLSAQSEHTIVITNRGADILTSRPLQHSG